MENQYINQYELNKIIPNDLLKYATILELSKGEVLLNQGESLENFYILLKGDAKVSATSLDGKSLVLQFFSAPTNLGDIELMTSTKIRSHVIACNHTIYLVLPIEQVKKIGLSDNIFIRYVAKNLSEKFDQVASISTHNLLYSLKNRLADYLLFYKKPSSHMVTFPFTHTELAELLGVSYRHLTRTLEELQKEGIITISNSKLDILNESALKQLSVSIYPHKED